MIDVALVAARFLHYAAVTTLAGVAFFPLYAYADAEPVSLARRRSEGLLWAALLALISGLAWFVFVAANMSGALGDLVDGDVLATVIGDTGFGALWSARMIVAAVLVAVTARRSRRRFPGGREILTAVLAGVLLASLAGAGHAQIEEGSAGALHVAADAAHLLAAGAWLGGLVALGILLLDAERTKVAPDVVDRALVRFSGMGYAAVATLVVTGLANSWFLVGSVSNLFSTRYGWILVAKMMFFVGMLALAAANRFWLLPAMKACGDDAQHLSDTVRRRLRIHVLGEQGLGLLVLASVSVLGTMRAAIGQ